MKKFYIGFLSALMVVTASAFYYDIEPDESLVFGVKGYSVDNLSVNPATGTWMMHVSLDLETPSTTPVPGVRSGVSAYAEIPQMQITRAEIAAHAGVTEEFVQNDMTTSALNSNITAIAVGKATTHFGF